MSSEALCTAAVLVQMLALHAPAQAQTQPAESADPEKLIQLSFVDKRDQWWPATQELGRLASTDDTLRARIWTEASINTLGMKFVLVRPGTFRMGPDTHRVFNPQWPHRVRITKPYYICVTETTNAMFQALFPDYESDARYSPDPDSPAVNIRWKDADRFCRRLSHREGVQYRLPTEAEWEYASRAGSKSRFCFGYSTSDLKDYAWYDCGYDTRAAPVALLRPNNWGIYDMHGNAWEWVADWYSDSYYWECLKQRTVRDPRGPDKGWSHVLRGGSWELWNTQCLTSTARCPLPLINWGPFSSQRVGVRETIGFRVVRDVEPERAASQEAGDNPPGDEVGERKGNQESSGGPGPRPTATGRGGCINTTTRAD
jgi:formylglycine-generating enzyme required for sulfatase activity